MFHLLWLSSYQKGAYHSSFCGRQKLNTQRYTAMEFIFELFAEMLGKADERICAPTAAEPEQSEAVQAETQEQPQAEVANIFNVVNFH